MKERLLLLGGDGDSTRIVYHHLAGQFGSFPAILEQPVSRRAIIRNRVRKLGVPKVASQLLFLVGARPVLAYLARQRLAAVKRGLDTRPIPPELVSNVSSVNSEDTIALIRQIAPEVIIVNGTRIIAERVLGSTEATFINTHAGITPQYRGAHGAYWALYCDDREHCGVTVHVVDPGIDTGEVIAQATIQPTAADNFVTYPYLQIGAALPLLSAAVKAAIDGRLGSRRAEGPSGVWYHPGIVQYLLGRLRGVR